MNSLRKPLQAFFTLVAATTLSVFGATGCQTDAFCWDNCPGDAPESGSSGSATGGAGGAGGNIGFGGEGGCIFGCQGTSSSSGAGACMITNGGIEICDKLDNDCNGKTDDGINFDSPKNCGTCDNNCYTQLTNADTAGIGCDWNQVPGNPGTCTCTGCAPGWYDFDGDCKCTYYCVKNADNDTQCNNKDDDCDGTVDENVDLCTSTTDCGVCGNNCVVLNGTPACTTTAPTGQACTTANTKCEIASCDTGWVDLDKSYATGCEYQCSPTNGGVEKCGDGLDNDCDGLIDSADDLSGDNKIGSICWGDEPLRRGICGLIANAGMYACVGNDYACVGPNVKIPGQIPETCNGQDDDCNGQTDDNPGDAGMACGTSNIFPCKKGTQQCVSGVLDCIGEVEPSAERCNGIDDNCNGTIDDAPNDVGTQCGPMTNVGACEFGVTQCTSGVVTCIGAVLPTTESCNMIDDDCDGAVDDVSGVGTSCGISNTMPCRFGTIQCVGQNLACVGNVDPTTEVCNMMDDDCDGQVDEGLPPQICVPMGTDPNLVYGGTSQCRRGTQACGGMCTGFVGPTNETCDGIDNNCNGMVDDGLMLGPCNVPIPPPAGATSPCRAGTFACTAGVQTCQGSVGPTSSVDACGVDSNCDGQLTGQPNFQTDVANCGSCGNNCYAGAVHSVWSCVMGMCVFQSCETGYYDLDNNRTCEYSCSYRSATEACNGQDDNCNGATDEMVTAPTPSQVCGVSSGNMRPECTTQVTVACVAGAWQCTFPPGVCPGGCSANDEICDTGAPLDNDCDGQINENVANYNQPCASDDSAPGTHGICRTTGNFVCNAAGTGTVCNAMKNNALIGPELCDGLDNDCDATIDEVKGTPGTNAMYYVKPAVTRVGYSYIPTGGTVAVTGSLWMYSYEASRPNASATTAGSGNGYQTSAPAGVTLDKTRACSEPNRVPWFNVSPLEVEQTCQAMGGSICSTQDWIGACKVADPSISAMNHCGWGYGPRANCTSGLTTSKYCNLQPYDFSATTSGDQDGLLPSAYTGTMLPFLQNCWADWSNLQGNSPTDNKIYDLTGNLREITRSSATTYPLMGGSFASDQSGATCTFSFYTTNSNAFQLYDLGFRCCFSTDPR